MRLKITFTLLAILLGLLTYIFYIDTRVDDDGVNEIRTNILGDLAVGIDHLSIQNNATGQRIALESNNKRWMIVEPYVWPANAFAVDRILTELRFLKRVSSFETDIVSQSGVSLNDYGLRPPQISLAFGRGDQRSTIGIGKPTDIGNNLYILSADKSLVHVVDRSLLESISIDLDSLRSPRLFNTAIFEVTSWNIQVRENGRNLRAWFIRDGDNWRFQTPISARADSAAVNTLLNRCLSLEADSIVASNPIDLSPYGLQTANYRIAVEAEQSREVLEIGDRISADSEFRYAKRESRPTVFKMRIEFLDLLAKAQTKLRERRIFEVDVNAATTVTIEQREEEPISLQKLENGSWEIVVRDAKQGMQTLKGDKQTIEEMLLWLDELKAVPDTGFVNDAPSAPDLESYGLEVPEYSIAITSNKLHGKPQTLPTPSTEILLIGDRSPREPLESYVKVQRRDFVYSVYNDVLEQIDVLPDRYKNRQILELTNGEAITKLEIQRIADGQPIASYDFTKEASIPEDGNTLAKLVSNLTVESFNPEGFTRTVEIAGREKPWVYKLLATIQRNDGDTAQQRTLELFISETTGGPLLYGGIPAQNLGFRFGIEFIDTFSKIAFDRVVREKPDAPFSSKPLPEPSGQTPPPSGDADAEPPPPQPEPDSAPDSQAPASPSN